MKIANLRGLQSEVLLQLCVIPTLIPSAVDECELKFDTCDPNAVCTDTPGGFSCACNPGFTGDGVLCLSEIITTVKLLFSSCQCIHLSCHPVQ